MSGPYKESDFESAIEAYLLAHGWTKGSPADYDRTLGIDATELESFLTATQPKRWASLVQTRFDGDETEARKVVRRSVAKLLNSRGVLRCMRDGVSIHGIDFDLAYFQPEHGLTEELTQLYEANRLAVTRQLAYSEKNNNALDLALFVNGIPVATAELKNVLTNQDVQLATTQYREDRDPSELLFARRAVVHFAVDTDEVYLTTELAGEATVFLPFNQGRDGGKGNPPAAAGEYATSYLWSEVWQRDAWLDLLRRFAHVQKANGKRTTIFPRYHQWAAVLATVSHARQHGAGHNYLIEHSAGSGKSNTIAWLAHRLALLHDENDQRVFEKVIVVTDRVVLDRQLGDTVYQFEHVPGLVQKARSGSGQLAKALSSKGSRIVISTLQKFPFVLDKLDELAELNYAVIIDEAHSSMGGEAAKALRQALGSAATGELEQESAEESGDPSPDVQDLLSASVQARGKQPNLSYFAFTATPSRRTLELFGSPEPGNKRGPFHLYSMRQAIEEGFILDVLKAYLPYAVLWKVSSETEKDKVVEKSKATEAIVRYVSRHPKTLAEKADIIVEHCRNVVRHEIGGQGKAMVVCASREVAVLTYFAIKAKVESEGYLDCEPLVAFSDSVSVEGEDYTETAINGFGGGELPARFASDDFRILVVAEKYQTGFDQPLLHTMYVDKKLRGIRAVQTLSRLNRIHPQKEGTFVLDFVNDGATIQRAFEDFYEATLTEATDPVELQVAHGNLTKFDVVNEADEKAFAEAFLGAGDVAAHATLLTYLAPALDRYSELDDDDRKEFRAALTKFVDLYAFLAQAIAYSDDRLEASYLYGRHLQRALPQESGGSLDLGGAIALTHLRTREGDERNISPQKAADASGPETGEVVEPVEPATDKLSQVIEDVNERHGSELGKDDLVILEKVLGGMAQDPDLVQEAKVNSKDNFLLVFGDPFEQGVMDAETANAKFFERFFSDDDFRTDLIRGFGEEFHRRHGEDDIAA
jgi:type I restriction enzyme R subunit